MSKPAIKSATQSTSALILAGGQSQRFNYNDKGLIHFLNRPMIAHVFERIAPQVTSISISCNRNSVQYQSIYKDYYQKTGIQPTSTAVPICFKDQSESPLQGPLAGIASYLEYGDSDTIFICSCDMPLIPFDIVQQLFDAMNESATDASYPVDENGQHHLALLIKRSAAVDALQQLMTTVDTETHNPERKTKTHSIKNWLNQINSHKMLINSHATAFADINSVTDMALIEQKTEQ
ncbi:MAG: NTP transferase domain-containing protein [Cellvibrionales bacterium]|jgi:molybdopterin-guanine dinucleotide biosynthesis protein A|nr:NTP transferase domain-containing protein [Cellvibrionales bacterium]